MFFPFVSRHKHWFQAANSETCMVHKNEPDVPVDTLWINLDIGNGIDFFLSLCLMVHYRFRFKAPKFLTGWVLWLAMLVFMDCCGHTRLRRILLWILSRGKGGDPGAPRLVYVPAHWLGERIFLLSGILPCFFYCHADILWFCQCNSPERS